MTGNESQLDVLGDEYIGRLRRGEAPAIDEYVARHPELEEDIRELFPVLAVMEGLKPPQPAAVESETRAGPERIGPYRILRELGRGGMGRVFEAVDDAGERVAIKVVHPHLVGRPGYLARFLREVETGSRIDHPGVVKTLASGVFEDDGVETPYLVLEFVEGQNLREMLEEVSPLSERLVRVIGVKIAEALAAVHAAGVVHRDVKPENVVICTDETVKLMDLGVALIQEETRRLSATGEFVGSLLYAAPEQIRGGHIGPETDVYALGLLLFELLTGHHVGVRDGRPRGSFVGMLHAPVSVREDAPHVTPFMDALVRVLLEPDPDLRPESAAAVARVLSEAEQSDWWRERAPEEDTERPRPEVPALIGRERELDQLDGLLAFVARGQGRACVIEGDAGIGKTHLVEAWLQRVEDRSTVPRFLEVDHLAVSADHATCPLAGALSTALEGRLEPAVRRVLDAEDELAAAVVRFFSGIEGEGPELSVAVLENAYVKLMEDLAEGQGLIVVVEDMHRSTMDRVESFLRIVRACARAPIVFVSTTRGPIPPAIAEELERIDHAEILSLGPLDLESSLQIAQSTIGGVISNASGVRELVRRADGNPYFLIELARALRRGPDTDTSAAPIPESLDALIEARLAALPPDMHDLLAAAACSGHVFEPDIVVAGAEIPRIAGLRMLHALDREHDLIEPVGAQYRFRHRLVQEKLRDGLPPALRRAYHSAIGAVLEGRLSGAHALPHVACDIANHYLRGEDPSSALPFVGDALDYLVAQYEPRRAAAMAERVLALDDVDVGLRAHATFVRGDGLKSYGPPKDALSVLEVARVLADEAGDTHLAMRIVAEVLGCMRAIGDVASALVVAAEAAQGVDELDDPWLAARIHSSHARLLRDLGRMEEARDAARHGLDQAMAAGDPVAVGTLSWSLGGIELELSDLATARVLLDRAVSIACMHGDIELESNALNALAKVEYLECKLPAAVDMLDRVMRIARERGDARVECVTAANLGQSTPYTGDYEAAERYSTLAAEISHSLGYYEVEAHALLSLAHVRSCQGRLGESIAVLEQARALISKMPTPSMEARLSVLLPNTLAWTGRFDEAQVLIDKGLEAARESGSPREALLIEWVEGLLYEARGQRAEALERLAAVNEKMAGTGALQMVAFHDQRIGELHAMEGHVDEARATLERALEIAAPGGLRGIAAQCRIWLDLLPGGNVLHARVELDKHGAYIPAPARLRSLHELATRIDDPALRDAAREEAGALVASVEPAFRDHMMHVPLYRDILEPV